MGSFDLPWWFVGGYYLLGLTIIIGSVYVAVKIIKRFKKK